MKSMCLHALRFMAVVAFLGFGADASRAGGVVATFDDLQLAPKSHWSGPDPNGTVVSGPYGNVVQGSFTTGGVGFANNAETTYGSWSGFAYSNTTDTTKPGYLNQFSAYTGGGHSGDNYGVAFGYHDLEENYLGNEPFDRFNVEHLAGLPQFTLPTGGGIEGLFVTNTTYAALSMLQGDSFAKKFGGASGNDADWFKLSAYGTDAAGVVLDSYVDFYLADYRSSDKYVVSDWRYMDLSTLAGAQTIYFNLSSSDVGAFGMNTPSYFAVDDVRYTIANAAVPEPSSVVLAGVGVIFLGVLVRRKRAA